MSEIVRADVVSEKTELEAQIETALRFPRDLEASQKRAVALATMSEDVAMSCLYAMNRGGKKIEGPSVRLAELIMHSWRNLRTQSRISEVANDYIVAEGAALCLESNTASSSEVRRSIVDRQGRRYSNDMITVTCNAASSIAVRNAVFKIVPQAFWWPVYEAARTRAVGEQRALPERVEKMRGYFQQLGVPEDAWLASAGVKDISEVGPDELALLLGVATSIKNGEQTLEEAFPKAPIKTEQPKTADTAVGAAIRNMKEQANVVDE